MSDVDWPAWADRFVELGFVDVGRVIAEDPDDPGLVELATQFPAEHRAHFLREAQTGTPIYVSGDSSCFVDLSDFWGQPSVRLHSLLDDGSLIETVRRWDHGGPAIIGSASNDWPIDLRMRFAHAPEGGRSIEVVSTDRADDTWNAHRAHVRRIADARNANPVDHSKLTTVLDIMQRGHDHQVAAYNVQIELRSHVAPMVLFVAAVPLALMAIINLSAIRYALAVGLLVVLAAIARRELGIRRDGVPTRLIPAFV